MKALTYVFILALLTSCTCHKEEIKPVRPIQAKDKHMSCNDLQVEITDSIFLKDMYKKRADSPELYAGSVSCLPATSFQLQRASVAAEDRLKYLQMLYDEKGCNKPKNVMPITTKEIPVKKKVIKKH